MPDINRATLNKYFLDFVDFVEQESGIPFTSFSNPYIDRQENYKFKVHSIALDNLRCLNWKRTDIGTGKIISRVISAIEVPKNNLLRWENQWGESARVHQSLYEARNDRAILKKYETVLYNFFCGSASAPQCFDALMNLAGKKYTFIAYLFFLKDIRMYMPIAPANFDKVFAMLGIDLITSKHCSWDNYGAYNALISEVRDFLASKIESEVQLLDAHSFLWICGRQMKNYRSKRKHRAKDIEAIEYLPRLLPKAGKKSNAQKNGTSQDVNMEEVSLARVQAGHAAEDYVLKFEQERLMGIDRPDLATQVRKVSQNAALGYDINSFDNGGTPRQIEVKSIKHFSGIKSFILTRNEFEKSIRLANYWLYFVTYANDGIPKIYFVRQPNLKDRSRFKLVPIQYRVMFV
ncbi:MAG: DUF3883 domain-containing protein [Chloroflexi bacterium]|nr:DUF3883 domain-containing protein [Chloroflexota bacterium]